MSACWFYAVFIGPRPRAHRRRRRCPGEPHRQEGLPACPLQVAPWRRLPARRGLPPL